MARSMMRAIAYTLPFFLAAAAAGSGDYQLVVRGEDIICVKSESLCEKARDAISDGRWPLVLPETPTACVPAPGCFPPESLVIRGFNDGR